MTNQTHSCAINHIALSVPNISDAVQWYREILGFQLIGNTIHHIIRCETPDAAIFHIYPSSLNEVKIAYMSTGNGVGFELFEFLDPKVYVSESDFEYHRGGFFHACVTDEDPEGLAERMVKAGGRRIGDLVDPTGAGVKCVYAQDPWGNVVEILDISFERLASLASPGSR